LRFLWLLLPLALLAKEITLQFLESKPRGLAKDYYIWRFLDQKITPKEAQRALELTQHVNYKILRRYILKSKNPHLKKILRCLGTPSYKLLQVDAECAALGVSGPKLLRLSPTQKKELFAKLAPFPKVRKKYAPFWSDDPYKASKSNPYQFLRIFFLSGKKNRAKFFNRPLSKIFIAKLTKSKSFPRFVRYCLSEKLERPVKSLLRFRANKLDAQSSFFLAIEAIKRGLPHAALAFLQNSEKKSYYQSHKDRANLWLYRLTHKKKYLDKVLHSWDLNLYVLLAYEWAHKPFTNFFVPNLKGRTSINLSDPFIAERLRKNLPPKNVVAYRNTQSLYALILEKESNFHRHPFILPYTLYLADQPVSKKALIHALARQESRFIPGSISRSFALGPLQFMPFLAKHTAKKLGVSHFDLDWMFKDSIAVGFAKDHIRYLQSRLHHPLLIAYAYNGGIGYVKKRVVPLFTKYDPLLAMELVNYPETKEYGKKVLANYIIYRKILGKPISLTPLLKRLAPLSRKLYGKR